MLSGSFRQAGFKYVFCGSQELHQHLSFPVCAIFKQCHELFAFNLGGVIDVINKQVIRADSQSICNSNQKIETHGLCTVFHITQMRLVAINHFRQFRLGNPLAFAKSFDSVSNFVEISTHVCSPPPSLLSTNYIIKR